MECCAELLFVEPAGERAPARVVFKGSGDLPRRWLGNRRVAGAGRFRSPRSHRSESPTGYSSTGCSPAEPASASPVTDDRSRSGLGPSNALLDFIAKAMSSCRLSSPPPGVSFLLCTPGDISILRRHVHTATHKPPFWSGRWRRLNFRRRAEMSRNGSRVSLGPGIKRPDFTTGKRGFVSTRGWGASPLRLLIQRAARAQIPNYMSWEAL